MRSRKTAPVVSATHRPWQQPVIVICAIVATFGLVCLGLLCVSATAAYPIIAVFTGIVLLGLTCLAISSGSRLRAGVAGKAYLEVDASPSLPPIRHPEATVPPQLPASTDTSTDRVGNNTDATSSGNRTRTARRPRLSVRIANIARSQEAVGSVARGAPVP